MIPAILMIVVFTGSFARAQDSVSREEFDALKASYENLLSRFNNMSTDFDALKEEGSTSELREELEELIEEIEQVDLKAIAGRPGTTGFLAAGFATTGFVDFDDNDSTFGASFTPVFLWKFTDNLMVEAELDLSLGDGTTEVELEYIQILYTVNDYVTVGAGKFLTPFGMFWERLHPSWINKLPDAPLSMRHTGLVPPTTVGVQVRGVIPIDSMKLNYAFFVGNGPSLATEDLDHLGNLEYENFIDNNGNKAFGGRLGFQPFPELEIGYSAYFAKVGSSGSEFRNVDATLHGPYLAYVSPIPALAGSIDVRFEWTWSDVDDASYDLGGTVTPPIVFDNRRSGGYAQVAYRPSLSGVSFLEDLEFVFRFDRIDNAAGHPDAIDRNGYTVGLNYWLEPNSVVKLAFRFDDPEGGEKNDGLMIQWTVGF